jgi:hypothetical protein
MATPSTFMRLAVSCVLAAAMLAACGGSQMSATPLGAAPQAAGAPNSQHSTMLPADDGGGCGGDTQGGFGPNKGHGCCGGDTQGGFGPNKSHGCCGGDTQGGFGPNDDDGCCGGGDGDSWQGGNGFHRNDGDEGGHQCRTKNISVKPNRIFFTPSSPGPVTVTVTTQKTGTVSEIDDCFGASGIATVAQGTGDQWTVTAGAQEGQCKALFILKNSGGHRIGLAVLHITNLL